MGSRSPKKLIFVPFSCRKLTDHVQVKTTAGAAQAENNTSSDSRKAVGGSVNGSMPYLSPQVEPSSSTYQKTCAPLFPYPSRHHFIVCVYSACLSINKRNLPAQRLEESPGATSPALGNDAVPKREFACCCTSQG